MSERKLPAWAIRLRAERERRGLSRPQMAKEMQKIAATLRVGNLEVQRSVENLKTWESGRVQAPDSIHQIVVAGVLGLTVGDLFGPAAATIQIASRLPARGTVDLPYYLNAEDDPVQRRHFMAWLAALSAGAVTLPDAVREAITIAGQQPDTLPRITSVDVDHLRATTEMFHAWDHRVGGGLSRQAVIGQLGWAVHQLDAGVTASTEDRRDWLSATALLASVAGFKSHDAGYDYDGRRYLTLGYRLASEADNRSVQAYLLSNLVRQAVHIDRPMTGLDLARLALQYGDDATATTRAMLHSIKARAHGRIGDKAGLQREAGRAEEAFTQIGGDDLTFEPWLRFYDSAELDGDLGTAWRLYAWHHPDAGPAAVTAAAQRLADAANRYGSAYPRSRAMCNLMAAGIEMRRGDPEAAVHLGHTVAPELERLRSARVDSYTRDLQKAASPFRRRPAVQEMLHTLAS